MDRDLRPITDVEARLQADGSAAAREVKVEQDKLDEDYPLSSVKNKSSRESQETVVRNQESG